MATFMPETFGEMVERVSDSGNPFDLVSNENFNLFVSLWVDANWDADFYTFSDDVLPRVQLYTHEDDCYVALDNRDGACLVEQFKTINGVADWLYERGEFAYE